MAIMQTAPGQTAPTLGLPWEADPQQQRVRAYSSQPPQTISVDLGQSAILAAPLASIAEFDYWQNEDQSWSAYSERLGVNALADTPTALVDEIREVVSDLWALLDARRDTLSSDLRALYESRPKYLSMREIPRP